MHPTLRKIVATHYAERLKMELGDPARLEALYGSRFWQQPAREKLRQFCVTAAKTLNTKHAYIVLVTDKSVEIVASNEDDERVRNELNWSVCPNVVGVHAPVVVPDARTTPVLCDVGSVRIGGVVTYLGVPLIARSGHVLGSFCVVDYEERDWSEIDVAMLTHLASALVTFHEAYESEKNIDEQDA